MLKSVCVFCASSSKIDEAYFTAAKELADVFVDNKIHVLYGGGGIGLMGTLADRILKRNGRITGIIPNFMKQLEWAHNDVTEMIVVEDMRERKKRMVENVDAIVALPGGVGTLEELLEIITLKQLGRFSKPIIIVNTNGFYDSLLKLFDEMAEKNFIRNEHRKIWEVVDTPLQVPAAINNSIKWDNNTAQKLIT